MQTGRLVIFLSTVCSAACTSLGPMPATTGISAAPLGRPGVEAQVGAVPGFYASRAARNEARGEPIQHLSVAFDPDRLIPVKGVLVGARIFGKSGDTPGEPYLGYRRQVNESIALAGIVFGSTKRSEIKLASYHGVRVGGEAAVAARLWKQNKWISYHAQAAASVTRILASGRYCVNDEGLATDCDVVTPSNNTMISGKTVGVFPAAIGMLSLEVGPQEGIFDGLRLSALGGFGRMPLVKDGDETGTGTYFTVGVALTLGVGIGEASRD